MSFARSRPGFLTRRIGNPSLFGSGIWLPNDYGTHAARRTLTSTTDKSASSGPRSNKENITMKHSRRELTTDHPATVSARARRIARTTLSAAALALAISPFSGLAVASAEWDIEKYDQCIVEHANLGLPFQHLVAYCCDQSGGIVAKDKVTGAYFCRAPDPEVQGGDETPPPPKVVVPTVPGVQPPTVGIG